MSAAIIDAAEDAAAIEATKSAGAVTEGKTKIKATVGDAKSGVGAGNGDAGAERGGEPHDNNNIKNTTTTKVYTSKDDSPSHTPTDTTTTTNTTRSSPPAPVAPTDKVAAGKVVEPAAKPQQADTKIADEEAGMKSPKSEPDEFLDVMSSLEREIAEMHHVEPTPPGQAKRVSHDDDIEPGYGSDEKVVLLEMKPPRSSHNSPALARETPPGRKTQAADEIIGVGEDSLEHDELIAVLKGIDQPAAAAAPAAEGAAAAEEGVTIEGEGEFQIMEIVDDEAAEAVAESATVKELRASAELRVGSPPSASVKKMAQTRKGHALTEAQVRALVLEQMAGLQTRRRRQPAGATAEGTEAAGSTATPPPPASTATPPPPASTATPTPPPSAATPRPPSTTRSTPSGDLVSSLGAEWSDDDEEARAEAGATAARETVKPKGGSPAKGKPPSKPEAKKEAEKAAGAAKPSGDKKQETAPKAAAGAEKAETRNPAGGAPTPAGFTRTRIIKRKIIWDPDAPETATTYAKTVRVTKKAAEPPGKQAAGGTPSGSKGRVQVVGAAVVAKTAPAAAAAAASPQLKRRSVTPVTNGSGAGGQAPAAGAPASPLVSAKKKKITEIDRLMGDEGAVNMLNALQGKRCAGMENESQRPLMRSRSSAAASDAKAANPTSGSSGNATNGKGSAAAAAATGASSSPPPPTPKRESPTTLADEVSPSPLNPAVVVQTNTSSTKRRQGARAKPSSTWDFVYQQQQLQQEDSMIIRRRSNSSYSSNASVRLSVDAMPEGLNVSGGGEKPYASMTCIAKGVKGAKFEFARPESKTCTAAAAGCAGPSPMSMKIHYVHAAAKGRGRPVKGPHVGGMSSPSSGSSSSIGGGSGNKRVAPHAVVKRNGNVCHIVFNTTDAKISYTFTGALMNKLVALLNQLANDDQCNAVLMITHMPHFCQGIDVTPLTVGNLEKRKQAAMELASSVKNYLKTLATFPKPLLAGVNGNNIGLGVTQLALFDVVVGSEKCSFETPYAKIGQLPEGHCFWLNSPKLKGNFRTKLFWYCEKVQNTEPVLGGLLNKLTQPGKVIDEVLQIAHKLASYSPQAYRAMKATPIHWGMPFIVKAMDEEFDTIVEQWTSNECYHYFKNFVEEKTRM